MDAKLEVIEVLRKSARAMRVGGREDLWEEAARWERRLIAELERAKAETEEHDDPDAPHGTGTDG